MRSRSYSVALWMCVWAVCGITEIGCDGPVAAKDSSPAVSSSNSANAPAQNEPVGDEPSHQKGYVSARVHQLSELKSTTVKLGGKEHQLFLMDDEGKRQEGMMFLHDSDVENNQGMLFVFPQTQKDDGQHGFWMRNCPLGLDIIYVNDKQSVVGIGKGEPFNEKPIAPGGDYRWVVELKQGSAEKLGIKKGSKLDLPKDLKSE